MDRLGRRISGRQMLMHLLWAVSLCMMMYAAFALRAPLEEMHPAELLSEEYPFRVLGPHRLAMGIGMLGVAAGYVSLAHFARERGRRRIWGLLSLLSVVGMIGGLVALYALGKTKEAASSVLKQ